MKRILKTLTGMATLLVLLAQPSFAQDKEKDKEKAEKDKVKSKNEEIVIRRKTDKDAKVTVEIRGDEVLVNGKPADDYEDENISITKRRTIISPRTPFRSQSGAWSFGSNNMHVFDSDVAFLGVTTDEHDKGVVIEKVTDESAAEKGGLKQGDIITKIDETTVKSHDQLTKAIRKHKPEEKATITYLRDGKEQKATVSLGKRSETGYQLLTPNASPNFDLNFDNGAFNRAYSFSGRGRLGVKAQDTEEGKGVKVIGIDEESIADKAGLKEGDIITEFDGKTINDADELSKAARDSREKASVTVKYTRDGKSQTTELKTPKKLKTTNL